MSAEPGSERDLLERKRAFDSLMWDLSMLDCAANSCHRLNDHFYRDIHTGEWLQMNPAEKIALMHSELSEMLEGVRKNLQDDHLPEFKSEEVEAADLFIRLLDYCGWRKLRFAEAVKAKLRYNTTRKDHTNEARREAHGKKF
ncbi:MAG TPA: hypothetical protein VFA39_15475 [Steroidobacteraceae bacterium]|nr:hypothetical protein [Steroidobacteraceae bacterium]